jgi:small-conductance mechanosensitive channel
MGKLFALFTKKVSTANLETEGVDKVTSDVTKVIEDVVSSESVGLLSNLKEYFTLPFLFKILNIVAALFIFYVLYKIIRKYTKKIGTKKLKPQTAMMLDKAIKYAFQILVVVYILGQFGIKLNALLGAAGIAGIAIGFAAQTSISNIISGFFVLWERALQIGDFITIDDVTGTVQSIDLLSVRIVTPDNQMIRIPN